MKVILHRDFSKQFAKLDKRLRIRFIERKDLFVNNPHHPLLDNHELDHDWVGCRSINITGDFRAIFRNVTDDTIEFLAVGTHHQLYGK